jgi:hypothetical protein
MINRAERYQRAVNNGLDYIVGCVNPDGSVRPADKGSFAYYKLPWALVLGGRFDAAARVIQRIVHDTMTTEGDFYTDKRSKFHRDYYTYENAWIVLAAHLLSFHDIAEKGWAYIERFQDPDTGGFCSKRPYEKNGNEVQDPLSTAWVMNVGLSLGRLEAAERAAGFLHMLWDIQPDVEHNFYYYWKPREGLILSRPAGEPDDRYFRINTDEPENWHYILGAQIAFLAKLYMATGEEKHLDLARRVRKFGLRCHEDILRSDSSGKFGYGNACLFRATGDRQYQDVAARCLDYLVEDQQAQGCWMRGGKPTASSTAEFVVWLIHFLCVEKMAEVPKEIDNDLLSAAS